MGEKVSSLMRRSLSCKLLDRNQKGTRSGAFDNVLKLEVSHRPVAGTGAPSGLSEGAGGDLTDIVAGQADIVESLVGKAAKLVDGAAIADPAFGKAERVHRRFLGQIIFRQPFWSGDEMFIHANNNNVQCKKCA